MSDFRHEPAETKSRLGGTQHIFRFPNGYGASVIQHYGSYGGNEGLWELGVLNAAGGLTYDTPITDDVLGWLTPEAVDETLDAVEALSPETAAS